MSFLQTLAQGGLNLNGAPLGAGKINEAIFGKRLGQTVNQLPLNMLVAPVTGAMSATGPASKTNADHMMEMIYGKGNVPSNMQQWDNWNTRLQPKPRKTTSEPSGGIIF